MPEQNISVDDLLMLISNHKDNHNKTKRKNSMLNLVLFSNKINYINFKLLTVTLMFDRGFYSQ